MASSSSNHGSGGGGGASGSRRASANNGVGGSWGEPDRKDRRSLYKSGGYMNGSHQTLYRDGAEASGSTDTLSSSSAHSRVTLGSDQITFSSDISVAHGITTDSVHGSVRFKTPPRVSLFGAPAVSEEATGFAAVGGRGASAAAATASGDSPLTNEAWLDMLSPLLPLLRSDVHPEDYLHNILRERGYSTEMVAVKETAFHRPPHPDQVAAYDKVVLRAVVDDDEAALERMRASGKRMDSCNRFGDSILHMSCRRGRIGALRYLLRVCPSGVLLTDDFGRTIMHDACWTATPRFDVASTVLDADLRLLRCVDNRGSSPLKYVPQDQWPLWCAFFENRKDIYWSPLAPGERDVHGDIPRA